MTGRIGAVARTRAHSACVGFGLERLTLALMDRHGIAVDAWPEAVREALKMAPPVVGDRGETSDPMAEPILPIAARAAGITASPPPMFMAGD